HQSRTDSITAKGCVRPKLSVQSISDRLRREFRTQNAGSPEFAPPLRLEHAATNFAVELLELCDTHAAREPGSNDRARRRSADEVEVLAKEKIFVAVARAQHFLDDVEVLESQNSADAAAVERENALMCHRSIEMLFLGQSHDSLLIVGEEAS